MGIRCQTCKCEVDRAVSTESGFLCIGCVHYELNTIRGKRDELAEENADLREEVQTAKTDKDAVIERCIDLITGRECGPAHKDLTFLQFVEAGGGKCPICLLKRVKELEEGIKQHRQSVQAHQAAGKPVLEIIDANLWKLLPEGKAGV